MVALRQKGRGGGRGACGSLSRPALFCRALRSPPRRFPPRSALHLHLSPRQNAGPAWRAGAQLNHALRAVMLSPSASARAAQGVRAAPLPAEGSLANTTSDRVWVTALKKEQGANKTGLVLRLFDVCGHADPGPAAGSRVEVGMDARAPVQALAHTDIVELNAAPLPAPPAGGPLSLGVGRCSIETFRVDVGL